MLGWLACSARGLTHCRDAADKKYKVFLSMSYVGNDWQAEAQNMVTAMARANPDKVELQIQNLRTGGSEANSAD